jgi:hypothetical protein
VSYVVVVSDGGQRPGSQLRRQLPTASLPARNVVRAGCWFASRPQNLNLGLSAWELACHALCGQRFAGQGPSLVVREYPPCTDYDCPIGHVTGTFREACSTMNNLLPPWTVRSVVADGWVVRPQVADELTLDPEYFRVRRILGLPEDFLADSEVSQLFSGEVLTDQLRAGAAEVVGTAGQIAADVDLPVRIRDLVDDLEPAIFHSAILDFRSHAWAHNAPSGWLARHRHPTQRGAAKR